MGNQPDDNPNNVIDQDQIEKASYSHSRSLPQLANSLSALVPVFWFAFALIAFVRLYPLAQVAVSKGWIDSVKVGVFELHLRAVPASLDDHNKQIGKNNSIPAKDRTVLAARFAQLAEITNGATVLWVDDKHPYQNANERRVLLAAHISVDLARTTNEAMEWLERAKYDVIITDLGRDQVQDYSARCHINSAFCESPVSDPPAPCFASPTPAEAGCELLRRVGTCFDTQSPERTSPSRECKSIISAQGERPPTMLIYSAKVVSSRGTPAYASRATNRAAELFNFVLDALDREHTAAASASSVDN
ncbi:MAG: hypothetical protein P4M07_06605 [Xanthobacteraceae bacterium]|nr:hypothetical protein [Xanthobacteraceae bacterium]